ncbi:hypothetical protein ElyMa_006716500 [Elysia marginata]|uniref:Secreted protein n=1 Tax=Elysia marginata TaxID=1093978 RepID=A0AAV4IU57_9GAST|nr:hypothetical protein ElyMa_006716500 [Elysia marginata]
MNIVSATLSVFVLTTLCLTLTSANDVQKRFLLGDVGDFTINSLRSYMRDLYDPVPFEPAMKMEAKRVRARIGQTLANVTNAQLNSIVMVLDKVYLDSDVNPSLSKLVWDVRQELGDTATDLTDTELGDVIYDILCQTKPEKDVIEFIKVLVVAAPVLSGIGG